MTKKSALYDILFNMNEITAVTVGKGSSLPKSRVNSNSLSLIIEENKKN